VPENLAAATDPRAIKTVAAHPLNRP